MFGGRQTPGREGAPGEAQMNMDVNLHRLPDKKEYNPKFLVPLAVMIQP